MKSNPTKTNAAGERGDWHSNYDKRPGNSSTPGGRAQEVSPTFLLALAMPRTAAALAANGAAITCMGQALPATTAALLALLGGR